MNAFVKSRKIVFLAVLTLLLALCLPVGGVAEEAATAFELPPARGAVDMSGLETYMAPEAAPSFQLPADHEQHPAGRAEAGSPVLDKALGVIGLPGMAGKTDDESTYEKAWRMSDSPNGGTRLTYGERYRRNPDGSYGAQSSSQWSGVNNVADRLLEQALSAGSGYFSSWAEGWLGGFGKARISVRVNDEGDVTGSGDFLYPIYDSERTTFFTQIGLRTMANDRVIGNFGLGQRFFPAENFALGYNVFLDQDFSRNHTRGGAGVEAWYDWVRLSANYYTPLSGWKDSEDYDSRLVEERPAEGYDARLTGYLPFYRNLAVTGAFEQWKGDHVGSFGSDDVVQKDPKIWSYGLEWTPVPAFSTSVNQRHSGGQKETQFGLTFNYHFGMDWEDQLSSATVTEMRTVGGSRHDFVNRQNEMILEYRAKEGVYNITLLRTVDATRNIFEFQLTNAFGAAAGQTVTVDVDGGAVVLDPVTNQAAASFITDANGRVQIQISPSAPGAVQVTLGAGQSRQTFSLNVISLAGLTLSVSSLAAYVDENVTVTATLLDASGQGLPGMNLTWTFDATDDGAVTFPSAGNTDGNGQATATLSSSVAQSVRVKVSATVNGVLVESAWSDAVVFSASVYRLTPNPAGLVLGKATDVTFTLEKNSAAAPNGTSIFFPAATGNTNLGLADGSSAETANNNGTFTLNLNGSVTGAQTVTATVEGQTVTCSVGVNDLILTPNDGPSFVDTSPYQSTATVTAKFDDGSGAPRPLTTSEQVTWTLKSVTKPAGDWWNRAEATFHGLAWGNNFTSTSPDTWQLDISKPSTDSQIEITDIVGSRKVTLTASVTIDGLVYTKEAEVEFGDGPLSVFSTAPVRAAWATDYFASDTNAIFPAAALCNSSAWSGKTWASTDFDAKAIAYWTDLGGSYYYAKDSQLPSQEDLQKVSGPGYYTGSRGAALAAGWPVAYYWTGEVVVDGDGARLVNLAVGSAGGAVVAYGLRVVCRP